MVTWALTFIQLDEIDKYEERYSCGWDEVRKQRHARLIEQKIIPSGWTCSPRDEFSPPWEDESVNRQWEAKRMAVYAAQVRRGTNVNKSSEQKSIMDKGIGRIIETLRETNQYEDTCIMFLSDNGGCAEHLKENGEESCFPEHYTGNTREGLPIRVGNTQDLNPGSEDTFMSYGLPWANCSNSPFRLFKAFVHEGGISSPFIVSWPRGMIELGETHLKQQSPGGAEKERKKRAKQLVHSPWILMDIVATIYDLAGISIPAELEGQSFLPLLTDCKELERENPMFWEHQGNCAVRLGDWKLVNRRCAEKSKSWELYNMKEDRTELVNLASKHPERVIEMMALWQHWAERVGVKAWPLQPIPEDERDWSNVPWDW